MKQKTRVGLKIIRNNRKARFNYFFTEFYEAGIVLKSSEVKSLREGKVNISESYAYENLLNIFPQDYHMRKILIY
jgi:SsrA-binding protein